MESADIDFLESNLKKYFSSKPNSVEGLKGRHDVEGGEYTTYAIESEDAPTRTERGDFHYGRCYMKSLKVEISSIIDGLVIAKEAEKPEGQSVLKRGVEVHFRSYPEISYISETEEDEARVKCTFRISVIHSIGNE